MLRRWIVPVIVLPGTALVFVPLLVMWVAGGTRWAAAPPSASSLVCWLTLLFAVPGGVLAIWSVAMFIRFGNGTAAPWDPPQRLVVRGPYRYVRNPMLAGVVLLLVAEALLFRSWALAVWAALFFVVNTFYFQRFEEPGLVRRFGDDYRDYCRHVHRWLPRLTPWPPDIAPPTGSDEIG